MPFEEYWKILEKENQYLSWYLKIKNFKNIKISNAILFLTPTRNLNLCYGTKLVL